MTVVYSFSTMRKRYVNELKEVCNVLKKLLATISMGSLLAFTCGQSNFVLADQKPYANQTITVLLPNYMQIPDVLLSGFTKETGIKVNQTLLGWDAEQTKITAAAAANTYFADVTTVDWSRSGEFYNAHWFLPLNKYFNHQQLSSISKAELDSFTVNGQYVALPADRFITTTLINQHDFRKAGIKTIPKTFAEFNADLKTLQKTGVSAHPLGVPLAAAEGLSTYWYTLTVALGGNMLSADNKPLFTSPSSAGYRALQYLVDSYTNGLIPKQEATLIDTQNGSEMMAQNRVAAIFAGWSGAVGGQYDDPSKSKVVGQVIYIPTPGVTGPAPSMYGQDGLGIPATAKHVDAAVAFINWFLSEKVQEELSGLPNPKYNILGLPANDAALNALIKAKHVEPGLVKMLQGKARSIFLNGAPSFYSAFSAAVNTNIHSAVLGQESVSQAVQAIANVVNQANS